MKETKYPIKDLEVNKSVTIQGLRNRIQVICSNYGKKHEKKFKVNKTENENEFNITRVS